MAGLEDVTAPLAVYRYSDVYPSTRERLLLIQRGSYLIADIKSQPYIDRGEAVLYRGIQNAEMFLFSRLTTADVRLRLMSVHARTLADSVTSFNAVHCNVSRLETGCFNDRSSMVGDLGLEAGLELQPPIMSLLYSGYALGSIIRDLLVQQASRRTFTLYAPPQLCVATMRGLFLRPHCSRGVLIWPYADIRVECGHIAGNQLIRRELNR